MYAQTNTILASRLGSWHFLAPPLRDTGSLVLVQGSSKHGLQCYILFCKNLHNFQSQDLFDSTPGNHICPNTGSQFRLGLFLYGTLGSPWGRRFLAPHSSAWVLGVQAVPTFGLLIWITRQSPKNQTHWAGFQSLAFGSHSALACWASRLVQQVTPRVSKQ